MLRSGSKRLQSATTEVIEDVLTYIDAARQHDRWVILVFHQIGAEEQRRGALAQADNEAILEAILRLGVRCSPIGKVLRDLA